LIYCSERPRPKLTRWTELDKIYPTDFHLLNAHERVEEYGDLWAHLLDAKHDLEALLGAIEG